MLMLFYDTFQGFVCKICVFEHNYFVFMMDLNRLKIVFISYLNQIFRYSSSRFGADTEGCVFTRIFLFVCWLFGLSTGLYKNHSIDFHEIQISLQIWIKGWIRGFLFHFPLTLVFWHFLRKWHMNGSIGMLRWLVSMKVYKRGLCSLGGGMLSTQF